MKLNNKGWETGPMLLMSLFLLLMLGLVWYYINLLYTGSLKKSPLSNSDQYYELVKSNLKNSAEKYYDDKSLSGSVVLSYTLLKNNGYIVDVDNSINESCTGYVTVNNKVFKPYIRCRNYTSESYVRDFE